MLVVFVLFGVVALEKIYLFSGTPTESQNIEDFENFFNEIDVEDEDAEVKTRNALNSPLQRWPGHIVPFTFSNDYTTEERAKVRDALQIFNEKTCIKFREHNNTSDGNIRYVYYKKSKDMCGTKVGSNPLSPSGPHDVVLNPYCLSKSGVIQHETMHVLGLYHEQSRPDRNKYIQIEYSNIPQKYWSQFISYPEIYTTTYNIGYDYKSLMHYSQYAFAKNTSKPSMRAKDGNKLIDRDMGQINGPSEADLTKIKMMYKCE